MSARKVLEKKERAVCLLEKHGYACSVVRFSKQHGKGMGWFMVTDEDKTRLRNGENIGYMCGDAGIAILGQDEIKKAQPHLSQTKDQHLNLHIYASDDRAYIHRTDGLAIPVRRYLPISKKN
jgi:hypothetical protein